MATLNLTPLKWIPTSPEELASASEAYPTLNSNGFPCPYLEERRKTLAERQEKFEKLRANLLGSTLMVGLSRAWIREFCTPQKTVSVRVGSYGFKHRIERYFSHYVSNGACIAAFILEGYKLRKYPNNPNCNFAARISNAAYWEYYGRSPSGKGLLR